MVVVLDSFGVTDSTEMYTGKDLNYISLRTISRDRHFGCHSLVT